MYKVIVDQCQVFRRKPLYTRHLIHELQQESMEARVIIRVSAANQLQKARKTCFLDHVRKRRLVRVAVEQEHAYYGVERPGLVLLQQAIDELLADILLVPLKYVALQ
jgi:hypothetical protein